MAKIELQIGEKTYNKAWIDNLSSTSQITSDGASINYGVVASTGNATLHDINGQIRADIENGVLPVSNAPTKVRLNDTQVQEHTTSDSDYSIIDKELNLQFSDRLSLLDKVTYGGMPLRDYSMTAYEMLDDVIGSYGDYAKEMPINWTKYQRKDAITTISGHNAIVVETGSGWEIIGTTIKVTPNKHYTINYSISTGSEYTTLASLNASGIPIQILKAYPTDTNCKDIAIATAYLSKTVAENVGTIEFTPTTDVVYMVLNFGWASDNQIITMSLNSISVNGNSLTAGTKNRCYEYLSGIGNVLATVGDKLFGITIKYPYLPQATYRETIEKFCTLAQITLALDEDGKIQFYDARPCIKDETEHEISKSYQIKNLNKTLFLKNKVDGVDIKQSKVIKTIDYNTVCMSENLDDFPDYTTNTNNDYKTATASDGRGVSFKTYYTTFSVKIPKKTDNGLKDIRRVLSGVDNEGNPFIQYTVTWHYQQLVKYSGGEEIVDVGNTETGDIASAIFYSTTGEKISDAMSCTLEYGATASVSCTDKSNIFTPYIFKETKDSNGANFWEATITILVGKEAKHSFVGSTTSVDNEYIGGRFTPLSVDISFYGDVQTISFEEVDLSTAGIENANNAVSISTNELMQNASDVEAIRDNILEDYANGVPTADIDLFYDENNKINKGDIICFNDDLSKYGDMNLWRVTGRTFKYSGSPTLSVELQKQTVVRFLNISKTDTTVTINRTSSPNHNASIGVITDKNFVYDGDVLSITVLSDNGCQLDTFTINKGTNYATGQTAAVTQTYTVDGDVSIIARSIATVPKYTLYVFAGENTTVSVNRTSSQNPYASIGVIANRSAIYAGDDLSIRVTANDGYKLSTFNINGESYLLGLDQTTANVTYTVTAHTNIVTSAESIQNYKQTWSGEESVTRVVTTGDEGISDGTNTWYTGSATKTLTVADGYIQNSSYDTKITVMVGDTTTTYDLTSARTKIANGTNLSENIKTSVYATLTSSGISVITETKSTSANSKAISAVICYITKIEQYY